MAFDFGPSSSSLNSSNSRLVELVALSAFACSSAAVASSAGPSSVVAASLAVVASSLVAWSVVAEESAAELLLEEQEQHGASLFAWEASMRNNTFFKRDLLLAELLVKLLRIVVELEVLLLDLILKMPPKNCQLQAAAPDTECSQ